MTRPRTTPPATQVRCAVYCRKSTEDGLEQEFNSLDAQRESAEAFIASQRSEGWLCVPTRYDDGGFTGGNMDRPALKRLMADIEAGKIDAVCVYKVDRLSRSLLDFARMMESFDKHKVAFVSVTQQFNTASSMGRLVLNVLLSFAQFEREMVSERTRDKIAATRRKGKWCGGMPLLGYDVTKDSKLVVNEMEAARVRSIFKLYLEHESLLPVVRELDRRGWNNKQWTTRKGKKQGGKPFTRTALYRLLTNVAYIGRVRYKTETHIGEHKGIIEESIFRQVQQVLKRNGVTGGAKMRNVGTSMLKGILRCGSCQCAMTPSHTCKGNRRYRYYTCGNAQKRGWDQCPSKSISAGEIERFVVDRIRVIGDDQNVLHEAIEQFRRHDTERLQEIETERRGLDRDVARWNAEVKQLAGAGHNGDAAIVAGRLADLHERIAQVERRRAELMEHVRSNEENAFDDDEVANALRHFDPVWEALTPKEQHRLIDLLVDSVTYDGANGKVTITFHPSGIRTLAEQSNRRPLGATA